MPYSNGIQYLGMNVTSRPSIIRKCARAVAYAVPYQKIMDAVLVRAGQAMFGAAGKPTEAVWPQAHMYNTDIGEAKALLAEAGYPDGFETTLSFDLGFAGVNEPLCVLVQESLGQIGTRPPSTRFPAPTGAPIEQERDAALPNVFLGCSTIPNTSSSGAITPKFDLQHHGLPIEGNGRLIDGAVAAGANGDKATYDTE